MSNRDRGGSSTGAHAAIRHYRNWRLGATKEMTDTARDQLFSGLSRLSILTEHGDQVCWEAGELTQIIEAYVDVRIKEAIASAWPYEKIDA